jgi:N-dimethylarginine dimethylaminohydrolase
MSTSLSQSQVDCIAPIYAPRTLPVPVTFLMCPPKLYEVNYVINPWMSGNVHASSRARAAEQWQQLYEAVASVADVVLIEPQPGSPDMVFTANAGVERHGTVVVSSFFHPERQGEEQHFRRWFQAARYRVINVPRETPFEGEGDALFTADGSHLWAGYGLRTFQSSQQYLMEAWGIAVISLHLIDPRFYHLDTCFAPLENGYVMYYPEAFDEGSIKRIEANYPSDQRILVSEADALRFACNVIDVNGTLILNEISSELRDELESKGFRVIEVTLSEFIKAGGAAKCLVMKLSGAVR